MRAEGTFCFLQYVADTKGKKYVQSIAQKYQNAYTPVEATKSYSDAVGEVMNDAISGIFSTEEGIHDFEQWMEKKEGSKKTQNVLEKLADHFKDVAESMRNLLNSGKLSKPAEDVATMAEKRASKVRKMILDELDVAIENAKNATVDEKAKSSAAYSVGDYSLRQKSYTYDAKNNEIVSDDGRIIPVADKIFSVSDIKNAEYIVRELVADQLNGLKGREFVIKETGEKVHVSRKFLRKYTHDRFMKYALAVDKMVKMNMSTDVSDLIENAMGLRHKSDLNGKHGVFAGRGWHYYDADIAVKFRNEYQIFR